MMVYDVSCEADNESVTPRPAPETQIQTCLQLVRGAIQELLVRRLDGPLNARDSAAYEELTQAEAHLLAVSLSHGLRPL